MSATSVPFTRKLRVALVLPLVLIASVATTGAAVQSDRDRDRTLPVAELAVGSELVATTGLRLTGIATPDDRSGRMFVVDKGGRIMVFHPETGTLDPQPLLDLTDRVSVAGNERGLLGVAPSPNFARTSSDRTTTMRTKLVIMMMIDGAMDRTVISATICSMRSVNMPLPFRSIESPPLAAAPAAAGAAAGAAAWAMVAATGAAKAICGVRTASSRRRGIRRFIRVTGGPLPWRRCRFRSPTRHRAWTEPDVRHCRGAR